MNTNSQCLYYTKDEAKDFINDGYKQCKKDILQKLMHLPSVETYRGKHVIHREAVEELLNN